jgi:hypothetical protein
MAMAMATIHYYDHYDRHDHHDGHDLHNHCDGNYLYLFHPIILFVPTITNYNTMHIFSSSLYEHSLVLQFKG